MATTNNAWPIPASTDYVKNGYDAIDDLGNAIDASVGTGLLAWQTYSPVLTGGWTTGTGTFDARYAKLGKIVIVYFQFTVGNGTKGTSFTFSLPVTGRATTGSFSPARLSRGATYYGVCSVGTTTAVLSTFDSSTTYLSTAAVSSSIPGTWTTGDVMTTLFTYEAA